jgi:hypothetical protein
VETAKDNEPQCPLFFGNGGGLRSGGFCGLALDAAEFFGVGKDNVHVLFGVGEVRKMCNGCTGGFLILRTLSNANKVPVSWRLSAMVTLIR